MRQLRDRFTEAEWQKLEKRAARVASDVKETDNRETISLMVMSLNGEHYGIDSKFVQAVHADTQIFALPNVPSHIAGLANLRGNMTTILDMQALLNTSSDEHQGNSSLVELHNHLLALKVDDVIGIQDYFVETLESLPEEINGTYTRGIFEDNTIYLGIDLILGDQSLVVNHS